MSAASRPQLERSPQARALAESALAGLLHGLGGVDVPIIVLGGLVPESLTRGQDPPAPVHLGTTDVDVLLSVQTMPGSGLSVVERSLRRMGFDPDPDGWRWHGRLQGHAVKIEFLCDLETAREHEVVHPDGCAALAALNLRGTGYVAEDWTWVHLSTQFEGEAISVKARFAELSGYLLSKCVAARTRGAAKDFYDLAYVLLHNRAGGPRQAAAILAKSDVNRAAIVLASTLVEIGERYRTPNAVGPTGYAEEALRAEPEADEAELRADAVAAVGEFLSHLDEVTDFRS